MRFVSFILACLFATPIFAAPATQPSRAAVIVLRGEIDDFSRSSLVRHFKQARELGVDTVILRINTYGGLVTAGLDISRFLKQQNDLHVIALVDEKAISAGAMIALACDEIVMQPNTLLGDCAPIALNPMGGGYETLGAAERAKSESPVLADFDDSACRNGYDPLLVSSMVSVGRVVHWMQSKDGERRFVDAATYEKLRNEGWTSVPEAPDPIDSENSLLTVGPALAVQLGLAKSVVHSADELAANRDLQIVATIERPAGDAIVALLGSSAVRAILTSLFLFTLYTSLSHPGHGGAEAAAVISLAMLVGVPLLTGYAQWWEICAILLGIGLLAMEVFVIPGFGVAGISGIVLVVVGLVMTWVGQEPAGFPGFFPQLPGTWAALRQGTTVVVSGMICSLLLWIWLQRYLPRLPYLNRLILSTTTGPLETDATIGVALPWPTIGATGRATTDLRPGGSAAFHDPVLSDERLTAVVSDGGFVAAGSAVVVRDIQGNRVLVRAVDLV